MGIKFCPQCESEEIYMEAGGITGNWTCKKCGFSGIFPEKEKIIKLKKTNKEK